MIALEDNQIDELFTKTALRPRPGRKAWSAKYPPGESAGEVQQTI